MKNKNIIYIILFIIYFLFLSKDIYAYDRIAAQKYLEKYWLKDSQQNRNYNVSIYHDYSNVGGDCANFGSQCLIAGNIILVPNQGAPNNTLPLANDLKTKLINEFKIATYFKPSSDTITTYHPNIKTGDIIFWTYQTQWAHHTLIVQENTGSDILYGAHTGDLYNESLENHNWPFDWNYENMLYIFLSDAPIVKYIKLTDVTGAIPLFEWRYDNDNDFDPLNTDASIEYYKHTYNGLTPGFAGGGVLVPAFDPSTDAIWLADNGQSLFHGVKVKIIFDQSMKQDAPTIKFGTLGNNFNEYVFTAAANTSQGNGWSKTLYDRDTWEGEFTISAANLTAIQKEAEGKLCWFKIEARSDLNNDEMDADNLLDAYNPGGDTVIAQGLRLDNFTPFVKKVLLYQPQIVNLEDIYSGHYNAGQMGGYYEAEWVWNANLNKYELKEIGDSNGFRNDYAVRIKVEFSESMDTYDYAADKVKEPEIKLIFSGNRDGGLITGGGWINNRTYEVETDGNYITGDVLATGESRSKDGIAILEVKAEDLAESATVGNNQNILEKECEYA